MQSYSEVLQAIGAKLLSGGRITSLYKLRCQPGEAASLAQLIAHEHSLELSPDVLPDGFLLQDIVGRVEDIKHEEDGSSRCVISYAEELASGGFTTLLNLLMGNAAFLKDVELLDVMLPPAVLQNLTGPRFGAAGIRAATRVPHGPLAATALKPLGASPRELSVIASKMALGGVDILKEDDGISTQAFAPFHERVERCAAAVQEANARTGHHTLYVPNITGPLETLAERAMFAKAKGAAGIEILPGMMSLDSIRMLAALPGLDMPIIAHCAWQAALCRAPNATMSMHMVFGLLPRLAGADMSIMTSFGGRFNLSREDCAATANALTQDIPPLRPALAMPGGGVTLDRLEDILSVFGEETAFLISGALFKHSDLEVSVRHYMDAVRVLRSTS